MNKIIWKLIDDIVYLLLFFELDIIEFQLYYFIVVTVEVGLQRASCYLDCDHE